MPFTDYRYTPPPPVHPIMAGGLLRTLPPRLCGAIPAVHEQVQDTEGTPTALICSRETDRMKVLFYAYQVTDARWLAICSVEYIWSTCIRYPPLATCFASSQIMCLGCFILNAPTRYLPVASLKSCHSLSSLTKTWLNLEKKNLPSFGES